MSTAEFEAIVEDFEFIDDWEDRYRYIIEKGKTMPSLDDALKVDATKFMDALAKFGCTQLLTTIYFILMATVMPL